MVRLSIDTETLGTHRGSVILQVACVNIDTGAEFNSYISRGSCWLAGLTADPETEAWWNLQDPKVQSKVFAGTDLLDETLYRLGSFIYHQRDGSKSIEVWMNSPTFDSEKILGPAFQATKRDLPWKYFEERDFRTLQSVCSTYLNIRYTKPVGAHDALVDAIAQGEYIRKVTQGLKA